VLVLSAVLIGALVVSTADRRASVWMVTHDVAAGTVLQSTDLVPVKVELGATAGRYLPVREVVTGRSVLHQIPGGQLLPRTELGQAQQGVTVTIPLPAENAPRVGRGDRITLWVTTKTCRGDVVISGAAVQEVRSAGSGTFSGDASVDIVVRLSADDAQRTVAALGIDGAVIRAGVLSPDQQPAPVLANIGQCGGTGT
jgi:hypothetical protein